jgi:ADP-heptose:LPS heptosyltransferase
MQQSAIGNEIGEVKKVLIIKGPGIGDVVTLVPLARNFKKTFECEVHLLDEFPPEKLGKILIKDSPYIDKIIRLDYSIQYLNPIWHKFRKELFTLKFLPDFFKLTRDILKLRKEKYDLIFDGFPGSNKTCLLSRLITSKYRITCSSNPARKEYDVILPIEGKNIVQAENSMFDFMGKKITQGDLKLELPFEDDIDKKTVGLCRKYGIDKRAVICINTGHGYKKWQNEKWIEFVDNISGSNVVILGDGGQSADAREIADKCKNKVIDLTGKLELEDTIALMRRMNLFVCTNGGLMWVATALGKPTVVISGATPYWWDPIGKNCKIVRKADESFYRQKEYVWTQNAKTEDITVEDVLENIRKLAGEMNEKS